MTRQYVATVVCAGMLVLAAALATAQTRSSLASSPDSDHDGLSDALEQALLVQFAPTFLIGQHDCSGEPSEFATGVTTPKPLASDGTIYGQVLPYADASGAAREVEIRYFHLWRRDCGGHGHPLDTEHVSVLVQASGTPLADTTWKALYWYAAAHENTVCDVSQIARASTLHAVDHGAKVWVSHGKHASYLNDAHCQRGCGADACTDMVALKPGKLINLGEPGHPMNGSLFIGSSAWPLGGKMAETNFPAAPIERLNQLPAADIAWFNAGQHPAQGIIAISSSTEQAIAGGGRDTTTALGDAGDSTGAAVSVAGDSTGNALQKSYRKTLHALGTSARHVGKALHAGETTKSDPPQ
jgi:hypothetical protein